MRIISSNPDGLSKRSIQQALAKGIDVDEDGNETAVYAAVGNLHMSQVVAVAQDEDGDMLLLTDHAQALMEQLGSWEEFIAD